MGWLASRGCSEAVTAAACSVVPMCPALPTTPHTLPSSPPAAAHAPRLTAAESQRDPRPAALPHHPTTARRHLEGQQADLVFQRGDSGVDGHLPLIPLNLTPWQSELRWQWRFFVRHRPRRAGTLESFPAAAILCPQVSGWHSTAGQHSSCFS